MIRSPLSWLTAMCLFAASAASAQLRITAPNGDELLEVGATVQIQWTGVPAATIITLDYSTNGGATWLPITAAAANLQYNWLIPNTVSRNCLLRASIPERVFRDAARYDGVGHTPDQFFNMYWSPDGRYLGLGGSQHILDVRDLSIYYDFTISKEPSLSFSPDAGRALFRNSGCRLVNLLTKQVLRQYQWNNAVNMYWSPVGSRFLSSGSEAMIWDTSSAVPLLTLKEVPWTVTQAYQQVYQWSPDGSRIIGTIGDTFNFGRIYNAGNGDSLFMLRGGPDGVIAVSYNPQGTRAITIGRDSVVKVWDAANGTLVARIATPKPMSPETVEWSPDGTQIVIGLRQDSAIIFSAATGLPVRTLRGMGFAVNAATWSKNGKWIVLSNATERHFVFEAATGRLIQTIGRPWAGGVQHDADLQFSPDGTMLASMDATGRVVIFFVEPNAPQSDASDAAWSILTDVPKFVTLAAGNVSARQSEKVEIPILLTDPAVARFRGLKQVRGTLHYDPTLLVFSTAGATGAVMTAPGSIDLTLPFTSSRDSVLTKLPFTATLGRDSVSRLTITNGACDVPGLAVNAGIGEFKLLDLCYAGGSARLVNPEGVISVTKIRPNPLAADLAFDVELIESGRTVIALADMKGTMIHTFADGELPVGRYTLRFDAHDVPCGKYFLVVDTPTIRVAQQVEVVR